MIHNNNNEHVTARYQKKIAVVEINNENFQFKRLQIHKLINITRSKLSRLLCHASL